MVLLLLVGLLSILGQVVLLRELVVASYGVELVYILALGAWLISTAAGAAFARGIRKTSPAGIGTLFLACAFVLPLEVAFTRTSRVLLGGVPGAYLTFEQQVTVMVAALLPIGALLGLLFQRAARAYVGGGRTLAAAYAIESAGGVVGGLLSAVAVAWGVPNFTLAAACAGVALGAAASSVRGRTALRVGVVVAAAGVAAVLLGASPAIDWRLTSRMHPGLVSSTDSPYGRITVVRTGPQVSVFENDSLSFESEGTDAEAFVHLAALAHPNPRRILVLGGIVDGLVGELLKHRPERLDAVEINRALTSSVVPHLPPAIRVPLADPRVRVFVDDPRRFLRTAGRYDFILIGMPEPASGQANRFYTREFFGQAATRLGDGGVLAFRLKGAENYWTPAVLRRTASIHRALASAFPAVLVLPGGTNILLASNRPLTRDTAVLAERLRARGIHARLVTPAYISYLYSNDRFEEVASKLAGSAAPMNSDARPICYQYTALIWLSKFFPGLSRVDPDPDRTTPSTGARVVFLGAFAFCLLALRRSVGTRRAALAALAGFIGMVLETVLLLHYQLKNGVVYQDIGILLTALMAGLAGGAFVLDWLARRASRGRLPAGGPKGRENPGRGLARTWGIAATLLFSALALGIGFLITRRPTVGLFDASALLAVTGMLVSAMFAYASLRAAPDQRAVIAPLYAADLAGGAVGSIVATLLLIPLAGLAPSAWWMAILAVGLLALV